MVNKIAVIIPTHNEGKVLAETIKSLLEFVQVKDIYLVNDGSSDNSLGIAKKYLKNVITLSKNQGKANALNQVIKQFKLTKRYKYIFPLDADTRIDKYFLKNILTQFEQDTKKEIVAVMGKVVGSTRSAITTYRLWEYEIAQSVHKRAQDILRAVMVCSGCATVYRSDLFDKVDFPSGTLTEDMDLTFMININKLGRITFCDKALVYTQDPLTISDLGKQLNRWYTGFWQCIAKHRVPFNKRLFAAEIILSATDGLMNSILIITLLLSLPYLLLQHSNWLLIILLLDFLFFLLPGVIFCAVKYNAWKIIKNIPYFYVLRIFSSVLFLIAFLKVIFNIDQSLNWNSLQRYSLIEKVGKNV